jgi:hypothetical protein
MPGGHWKAFGTDENMRGGNDIREVLEICFFTEGNQENKENRRGNNGL